MKSLTFFIVLLLFASFSQAQNPTRELLFGKWGCDAEKTIDMMSEQTKERLQEDPNGVDMLKQLFMTFNQDGKVEYGLDETVAASGQWQLDNNIISMNLIGPEGQSMDMKFMVAIGGDLLGMTKIEGPEYFLSLLWFRKE